MVNAAARNICCASARFALAHQWGRRRASGETPPPCCIRVCCMHSGHAAAPGKPCRAASPLRPAAQPPAATAGRVAIPIQICLGTNIVCRCRGLQERALLKRFKGVGDGGVDIFFREAQVREI